MRTLNKITKITTVFIFAGCATLQSTSETGFVVDDTHESWHKRYYFEAVEHCKRQTTVSVKDCLLDKKYVVDGVGVNTRDVEERTRITASMRAAEQDGKTADISLIKLQEVEDTRFDMRADKFLTKYRPIIDAQDNSQTSVNADMYSCVQFIKHLDSAHQPKYLKGFLAAGLIGLATAPKRARNANERADRQRVIANTGGLYKGRTMPSMPDHDTQNQVLRNCMKHRGYAVLF